MSKNTFLVLLSYLTIYFVWGSTYFFIKLAVETMPPIYVIGFRWLVGGILIIGFSFFTGRIKKMPSLREIGAAAFLGVILIIGGNGLITIAEKKVDSYLVALILACTPIVIAFFDWLLFKKKLTGVNLIGIVIGVSGVALVLYNGKSFFSSFSPALILVLLGLLLWSFGTSIGHKIRVYSDNLVNSGIQMLVVGTVCFLGMAFTKPSPLSLIPQFSISSWIGVWYLATIGSLTFCAYTYLIAKEPAVRVASYAFVNPLIATFLGLVIGGETLVPLLIYGLPLILLGLFLILYGDTSWANLKSYFGLNSGEGLKKLE